MGGGKLNRCLVARHDVARHGSARLGTAQPCTDGTARPDPVRHGSARHGPTRHGSARHSPARTARPDSARRGTARHSSTRHGSVVLPSPTLPPPPALPYPFRAPFSTTFSPPQSPGSHRSSNAGMTAELFEFIATITYHPRFLCGRISIQHNSLSRQFLMISLWSNRWFLCI